ncbi:MAG TPA: 2OG-Fe(II) oxygenase [Pyrinomonadaceae bacterium]|nr:2OG-Fe(II) oxygenase [Pyrinomonadaceae bacterium]
MLVAEGIYTFDGILAREECDEYISWTEALGYSAAPISTAAGFVMRPDIRNNARVIIDDADRARQLWSRVEANVPRILEGRQVIGLNERFRFYRYDPGEQFAPHTDGCFRRDNGEESLLTFMIYLNEGCEGGETNFGEVQIVPKTGMGLIFDHDLLHEGAAVLSGRKYVLRSDVMYGRIGHLRG